MAIHAMPVMCLFGVPHMAVSAGVPDGRGALPPFRAGEVAVYATPDELSGRKVIRFLPHAGISVVAVDPGRELAQVQRLRDRGRHAGLNYVAQAFATVDDPFYVPYQWNLTRVQSASAWDLTDGFGVTVAVLDTGLQPNGPDGIGCVTSQIDIVNGDDDASDGDGHGTHVSGTIAQWTDNGTGVAGLAYGACVMPVKVLDDTGSGSFADIADGVYYAVDHGAEVINMSLGIAAQWAITDDAVLGPALDYAYEKGVTVVCAAGNDGSAQNVSYPGSHPTTIAVGATDFNDQVTPYSNRGEGLDIMAPGGDTDADANGDGYGDGILQETDIGDGWGYYFFQGTSMASPHVAAAAAMLIANGTATTPDEVYQALTHTALDLGNPGYDATYGYGLVQAYSALEATSVGSNLAPTASFTATCADLSCDFDAGGSSDSDGTIVRYDWRFGDEKQGAGSGVAYSYIYANPGTYSVTLTVTDDDGATAVDSQEVTVATATAPSAPANVAAADNRDGTAHIAWSDTSSDEDGFQVEREKANKRGRWTGRSLVATTAPDAGYIDDPSGAGTFHYRVGAFNSLGISWSDWSDTVLVTDPASGGGRRSGPGKGYCKKNPHDVACQ